MSTTKLGRQGYVVVFHKFLDGSWDWRVESHNGAIVAVAPGFSRSRYDAKRSFDRMLHGLNISNFTYSSEGLD